MSAPSSVRPGSTGRLAWADTMKGMAILLIVYFHFFSAFDSGRYPWPLGVSSLISFVSQCAPGLSWTTLSCLTEACLAALFQRGPHAVGVFLVLSGFVLTYALTRDGYPREGWARWYRRRLLRLFPMYWAAHLVYLVSPLVYRKDDVDYRFVLSFLGDRILPADTMFFYLNPSWWFFGLLVQLYLVFPILFRILRKVGTVQFLTICGSLTIVSRYLLLYVIPVSGNYLQGAFFGSRLWEFAAGMALGAVYRRSPGAVEEGLFSWRMLLGGIVIYTLGIYCYQPNFANTLSDALLGTGFFIILTHIARQACRLPVLGWLLPYIGLYSYGIFLLHHPYVFYFGERLRGGSMTSFVVLGSVIIAGITVGAIFVERLVNRVTTRIEKGFRASAPAA